MIKSNKPFASILLMFLFGFNSSVGTNLTGIDSYYLIPGISWIDIFIAVNFLILIAKKAGQLVLMRSKYEKWLIILLLTLSCWFVFSSAFNMYRFETHFSDFFPAAKLASFVMLVYVVKIYSIRYGLSSLIWGFLFGVALCLYIEIPLSDSSVGGIILLPNPNVTGMQLVIGILMSSILLLLGGNIFLLISISFLFFSATIMTFSKGAWLGALISLLLFFMIAIIRQTKPINLSIKRFTKFLVFITLILFISYSYRYFDQIHFITNLKMDSSAGENASFDVRENLALAGFKAATDYPLFGLGYRNFYQVVTLYPELHLPNEPGLNAHNLFAQMAATSGIVGLTIFLTLFCLPFIILNNNLKMLSISNSNRILIISMFVLVWGLFASVQLQMIAQPPFWFFCGLIIALPEYSMLHLKKMPLNELF